VGGRLFKLVGEIVHRLLNEQIQFDEARLASDEHNED
jgi:hypothetical protein